MKHKTDNIDFMCKKATVESLTEASISGNSAPIQGSVYSVPDKSVGIINRAVVVGCNSNNDNASARTVNSNHAVSNANDNYAGRFALPLKEKIHDNNTFGRPYTARSARTNITEEATNDFDEVMELLRCEYSTTSVSESNATSPERDSIWHELHLANKKRKLKNMKRFLTNRTIVAAGVDRCLEKASKSPQREKAKLNREKIINQIIEDFTEEKYKVGRITNRTLPKRNKDGKSRNANIFQIYDRCVQNVILIVIQEKIHNKFPRNILSGIPGRSMLSNDPKYCLINQVRDYCTRHPDDYVMMTDIKKFYESLKPEIVLSVMFEFIQDRYLRILLDEILTSLPSVPIGGTLSQACAMITLLECDQLILQKFHPTYYCGFGDNRLFGDADKHKLIKIKEFQDCYYVGRFELKLKNDYSLHKIRNGFRFCRTDFKPGYAKVRGEIRRRAIRGAIKGQQHYAGYKGYLMKTDSKRLRFLIENNLSLLRKHIFIVNDDRYGQLDEYMSQLNKTPNNTDFIGEKIELSFFIDKTVTITAFRTEKTKKEEGKDYYSFQLMVPVIRNGAKEILAYRTWNSSADIRYFFERVEAGIIELPVKTKVKKRGNSFYFENYDDYTKDKTQEIIASMNIQFDDADFNLDTNT